MDTAQTSQQKRSIRVKDFLDDFRAGATDLQLMAKYQLSSQGLERFYGMLVDRGILDAETIQNRTWDSGPSKPAAVQEEAPIEAAAEDPVQDVSRDMPPDEAPAAERSGVPEEDIPISREEDSGGYAWTGGPEEQPAAHCAQGDMSADPIEIPMSELEQGSFMDEPAGRDQLAADLGEEMDEDPMDEIVPGMPLDYVDRSEEDLFSQSAKCPHCDRTLDEEVRKTYERSGGIKALATAALFLILGAIGAWALTLFEGYSVTRLVTVYLTSMAMLVGSGLISIAIFMLYLARERVFVCYSCRRAYPRS